MEVIWDTKLLMQSQKKERHSVSASVTFICKCMSLGVEADVKLLFV